MNRLVLNTENQEFINTNLNTDVTHLLFKKHVNITVDLKLLIEQLEAKKRCQNKLPNWFNTEYIYYPNKLNIEQTSSEITAAYKADLVSGESLIDLTGGFGVDSYYFAKQLPVITHCEINTELSEIVSHNYEQLGIRNINCLAVDGIAFLKTSPTTYSWIYIDPSRRHDQKGKVFFLKDCLPQVPESLDVLFARANNILIKTAPLLDISVGIGELRHVKTIHVVAVNNEVKELLWVLENGFEGNITICTANIKQDITDHFNFTLSDEATAKANYSEPLAYLYEPNASIMKSGAFNSVSQQLGLNKLHQHSHLYTSNELVNFPGRRFQVLKVLPYNKKAFRKTGISKANVTTRNFPEPVQQIRKKLGLADGGDMYLFFTTSLTDERVVLVCEKTT